jgi:mannose-6-phosphate isomerase-like protein (cupin superfamily)
MRVIPRSDLDAGNFSAELQGKDCGEPGISLILVDAPPGRGPALHVHDYAEVMIVLEGTATFTAGTASSTRGKQRSGRSTSTSRTRSRPAGSEVREDELGRGS